MPIQGLTTSGRSQLVELGRLRKGAPKEANRAGADLKYFRFDSPDPIIAEAFTQAYGAQPTRINCFLPAPTLDENLSAFRELHNASGLVHRCDGEFVYAYDLSGKLVRTNTPCPTKDLPDMIESKSGYPMKNPAKCSPKGAMNIMIPELRRFGFVRFLTSSVHDLIKLSGELNAIYNIAGTLMGIPLVLFRKPEPIKRPTQTEGKRGTDIRHMCHIEIHPEYAAQKFNAMQVAALASVGQASYALPAPSAAMALPEPNRTIDYGTGEIFDDESEYEIEAESGASFAPVAEPEQWHGLSKTYPQPNWSDAQRAKAISRCRSFIRDLNPNDSRFLLDLESLDNGKIEALGLELAGK